MKLTPVVLSYNHLDLTRRCINSVSALLGSGGILVHNGSQKLISETLRTEFPHMDHVVIENNRGFSGGANAGLSRAFQLGWREVLFLTNDTTLEKFRWTPPAFASGFLLAPRIERRKTGIVDSLGGRLNFLKGNLKHHASVPERTDFGFYVPGTAFLIDQKAWEKTGKMDETLDTYWEDVDYSLRAHKAGVTLGVIPEIVLNHGVGKTCHGNPQYSVFLFHRNRRRVTRRHGSLWQRSVFNLYYFFDIAKKMIRYLMRRDLVRLKLIVRAFH